MLDKRLFNIFDGEDPTPALREFLTFVDSYPKDGRLDPEIVSAAAFVARLDQSRLNSFVQTMNCDWEQVLHEVYESPKAVKQSRRKLVAGVIEAANAKREWDLDAAFACLSAIVENPGISWPNRPLHFSKISVILGRFLAAGIRMPNEGKYYVLRGKLEMYFKGFADGDPTLSQINELFGLSHQTFRKTPEAPFDDSKFRRFLNVIVDESDRLPTLPATFDIQRALGSLESDYLDWESQYGAYRWYELRPPAQIEPVGGEFSILAKSFGGGRPTKSWFKRASDALDKNKISREYLELLLSTLGTRAFADRSEPLWHAAKPALYLYALFRHHDGEIDPFAAYRFVRGKLRRILSEGMFYDAHISTTMSGTYRNPLCPSKENMPFVMAACWFLSLFDDDRAATMLGEISISLGANFETPGRGRYLRALAGSSAAISALKGMRSPLARSILHDCKHKLDDPRLLTLL